MDFYASTICRKANTAGEHQLDLFSVLGETC